MTMGLLEEFCKAIGKIRLPDIQLIKVEPHISKLVLGNQEYKVENNIINGGQTESVRVITSPQGHLEFVLPDGTTLIPRAEGRPANRDFLENNGRVFTRADLAPVQVPFLTIEQEHEKIIRLLKPYLQGYRMNADLGFLLVASTIIKLEDVATDRRMLETYYAKLRGKEGHMIYNFFRSGLLQKEVIPYLAQLKKTHTTEMDIRKNFLIYWYGIIDAGHPAAYYVKEQDTQRDLHHEIAWRINRGQKQIEVYSRTWSRNLRVARWLRRLQRRKYLKFTPSKKYQIGNSIAIKFMVARY